MSGTLGAPAAPAMLNRRRPTFWFLAEIVAPLLWVYVLLKVFVVDVDVYISQWLFPDFLWVLNLRFAFFLVVVALLLLLLGRADGLLVLTYFAFYPLILVAWKIPALIYRRKSWTLAFVLFNSVVNFFQGLRYRAIATACWVVACIAVVVSNDRFWLSGACAVLVAVLCASYWRRLWLIVQPSGLFSVYRTIFCKLGEHMATSGKLDDDMRALTLVDYDEHQLQQWKSKLEHAVLFNRATLFCARRLNDYQKNGFHMLSAVLTGLTMVATTTLTFGLIHYAIYKIDPASFETTTSPSVFTFFYYSFNAFTFGTIKELIPISMVSQGASMLEGFFALFVGALFVSLVLPFRTQRLTTELGDAIQVIEREGAEMDRFIRAEYKVDNVEIAMAELQKMQASLSKVLLFLTEGISSPDDSPQAAPAHTPPASPAPPKTSLPLPVADPPDADLRAPKPPRRRPSARSRDA